MNVYDYNMVDLKDCGRRDMLACRDDVWNAKMLMRLESARTAVCNNEDQRSLNENG